MRPVPAAAPAGSVLPTIGEDLAAAAMHGTFCPKMCSFACPVAAATGRDDALPWSFHRTVDDLASGRGDPAAARHLVEACTGCHACRDACTFEQDVPAQVRAGRAAVRAAGAQAPEVDQALERVRRGRSPYPQPVARAPADADADELDHAEVVVLVGCRERQETVDAHVRLMAAAGVDAAWLVADGCCGAAVRDLGAPVMADERGEGLRERLDEIGPATVVALDPHCLPELAADDHGARVVDAVTHLVELVADGRLTLVADGDLDASFHDPCLLARDHGIVDEPRELLRRAGVRLVEPEDHGARTRCTGGGMAMPLLALDDASATGDARAAQLRATGVDRVVTACSGAHRRLVDAGMDALDLYVVLARAASMPPSDRGAPS